MSHKPKTILPIQFLEPEPTRTQTVLEVKAILHQDHTPRVLIVHQEVLALLVVVVEDLLEMAEEDN
jgi:hypothetical protein